MSTQPTSPETSETSAPTTEAMPTGTGTDRVSDQRAPSEQAGAAAHGDAPQPPQDPHLERLIGHVAADLTRLVLSNKEQLVEAGEYVADKATRLLGILAPQHKETIADAVTTAVDAVTHAVAEQSSGELFVHVRSLLERDPTGQVVELLSQALDVAEQGGEVLPECFEVEIEAGADSVAELLWECGYGCAHCGAL